MHACRQVSQNGGEIKSLQDLPEYPREFVVRRLVVFVGIVIGCACPCVPGNVTFCLLHRTSLLLDQQYTLLESQEQCSHAMGNPSTNSCTV